MICSYSQSVGHFNPEHETESVLSYFRLSARFSFKAFSVMDEIWYGPVDTKFSPNDFFLINSGPAHKASTAGT